jgi:ATP-binding protein involved in chromosome partitioning
MDPRPAIIGKRLERIRRIIAVSSGKGGVGKSSVAAALAVVLRDLDYRTGLLDLDFYGPSAHVILGAGRRRPREDKGLIPVQVKGIDFLSIVHFAGNKPSPMRGPALTDALTEMLAVTRWGPLDFLVVDMPPGLGDPMLDAMRLLKNARYLVVTTPSRVALETVRKLVGLLTEQKAHLLGFVENMRKPGDPPAADRLKPFRLRLLGTLPYDTRLEASLGSATELGRTHFARALKDIVLRTTDFP